MDMTDLNLETLTKKLESGDKEERLEAATTLSTVRMMQQ